MIFLEEVGFEPGSAKNVNDKNYKAVTLSITPQLLIVLENNWIASLESEYIGILSHTFEINKSELKYFQKNCCSVGDLISWLGSVLC